jgi:putative membrane protein
MMRWWGDWSGWTWTLMMLGMVAFWAAIAWIVVIALRSTPPSRGGSHLAEDVLAERFARGEIDEAEYQRRVEALRASARSR